MNLANNVNKIISIGYNNYKVKPLSLLPLLSLLPSIGPIRPVSSIESVPPILSVLQSPFLKPLGSRTFTKTTISNKNKIKFDFTHTSYDVKRSKIASANDGNHYEDKVYKKLVDIFGELNVQREKDISEMLNSFSNDIPKSKLKGIDFIIDTKYKDISTLFVIQVKIGARTRKNVEVEPFIRTLKVLRKFVEKNKKHSYYKKQIIPIWLSSAQLDPIAKKNLDNNFVQNYINSSWSIDIDNCNLFTTFIKKLYINNQTKVKHNHTK